MERDVHLSDFQIPVGISWAGKTLAQLNLGRQFGVHAVSILRGNERINIPSGQTAILPGDRLQVIGSDCQLATFGQALESLSLKAQEYVSEHSEMKLSRIVVDFGSPLIGQNLRDSGIREDYRCLVVGLEEEKSGSLAAPNPTLPLKAADILWVVGEEKDLETLEQVCHAIVK